MIQNNQLNEQLAYIGESRTATHFHLCCYNAAGISRMEEKESDRLLDALRTDAVNWVQVHGLRDTDAIRSICNHFGIDLLTAQDILNPEHPTKIEEHENYNLLILKQLVRTEEGVCEPRQLAIVQGADFLLSFVEGEQDALGEIHAALDKNVMKIRSRGSDFLMSVVLNSVMVRFMEIISGLEDELEELEEAQLSPGGGAGGVLPDIGELQLYRRNFRVIKRCITPLKEEFGKLLHAENRLLHKSTYPFLEDVNDHLKFVLQTLDGCREMTSALVDVYLANNDLRMNSIMKQLAVVSTIFIPLTFLVGVWGMNFQRMPELEWRYGYLFAWVVMLATVVAVFAYLRRKRWY